MRSSLYKGLVNRAPLFRLSYCPPSFPLYWFLFLLPLLPGTLGEREGKRESQRIDRGKGSADSLLSRESGIKILNSHTLCIERISRLIQFRSKQFHCVEQFHCVGHVFFRKAIVTMVDYASFPPWTATASKDASRMPVGQWPHSQPPPLLLYSRISSHECNNETREQS